MNGCAYALDADRIAQILYGWSVPIADLLTTALAITLKLAVIH